MSRTGKDFPDDFNLKPGDISITTEQALQIAKLPPIDNHDPEQIKQRLEWYFDFCQKTDTRPIVSGICLALNTTRPTLIKWESENTERRQLIRQAKSVIKYLLELWSVSGRLSPPIAIFWGKNYLGLSDTINITAQAAEPETKDNLTPQQIEQIIREDIPVYDDDPEPAVLTDNVL